MKLPFRVSNLLNVKNIFTLKQSINLFVVLMLLASSTVKAELRHAVISNNNKKISNTSELLTAYCIEVLPNMYKGPNRVEDPKLIEVYLLITEDKEMKIGKSLKLAAATGALLVSSMSFAQAINIGTNDLAIKGYDPVAYFTMDKAVEGSAKFTATHDGAIYRFSSEKNRDLFKADADKYAPQFGGYCAMGVALNKKLDVDPSAFYIKEDKLYLNLNKDVQKKWLTDIPGHLKTANRVWRGIEDLSVADANAED